MISKELSSLNLPPSDENLNENIDQPDEPVIMNELMNESTVNHTPTPLPGVKLPKTKLQWEEANLFFHLNVGISSPIDDINSFAQNLQHTIIYSYSASNYGTLTTDNYIHNNKYNDMTVKQLKRELSILKKDQMNGAEIKYVSKLIRKQIE